MVTYSLSNLYSKEFSFDKNNTAQNKIYLKKSTSYNVDKKGKKKHAHSTIRTFDKNGNNNSVLWYNGRNKIIKSQQLIFNDSGKVLSYISMNRRGIITKKDSFIYDTNGNLICEIEYRRKGKMLKRKTAIKYNSEGKATEIDYFRYNKKMVERLTSRYITNYNESGTKKETRYYNGKGKLKYIWDFECNPEGAPVSTILKDTTKICVKYDYQEDGSKIKILIFTDGKDRITKTIEKYNSQGKLTEYANYNRKNKIIRKYTYTYDNNNNNTSYTEYKRQGKKTKRQNIMEYDERNLLKTLHTYRNTKLKSKYFYEYDDNGLKTESLLFKNNQHANKLFQYNYEFYK